HESVVQAAFEPVDSPGNNGRDQGKPIPLVTAEQMTHGESRAGNRNKPHTPPQERAVAVKIAVLRFFVTFEKDAGRRVALPVLPKIGRVVALPSFHILILRL